MTYRAITVVRRLPPQTMSRVTHGTWCGASFYYSVRGGGCSIYHGTLTFPCLSHAVEIQTKCKFGSASSMMNHHGAVITLSHQLHLKSCNFYVSKMVGK